MAAPSRQPGDDAAIGVPANISPAVRFFRVRTAKERRMAVEAWVALGAAPVVIRLFGVARSARLFRKIRASLTPPTSSRQATETRAAAMTVEAVEMASRRLPFSFSCLHRGLAAGSVLRLHGIDAELRFGVRSVGGELDGHAWLAVGDDALGTMDRPSPSYTVFEALESA